MLISINRATNIIIHGNSALADEDNPNFLVARKARSVHGILLDGRGGNENETART